MLRMRIDAELTRRLQLGDSYSWVCVGMADLTLERSGDSETQLSKLYRLVDEFEARPRR